MCVCVCVCVCARARARVCVCVCVCVLCARARLPAHTYVCHSRQAQKTSLKTCNLESEVYTGCVRSLVGVSDRSRNS